MDIDLDSLQVKNNADSDRFEVQLGDDIGFITYRKLRNGTYVLLHTEVPAAYNGQGVAGKLTHDALEMIRAEGGKAVPECEYVKHYLERHPEYDDLVVALRE